MSHRAHSLIICKINITSSSQKTKCSLKLRVYKVMDAWRMCVQLVVASLLHKAAMTS